MLKGFPLRNELTNNELRPAGFWIRLVAGTIDFIILAIPLAVFVSFLSVGMGTWQAFLDLHPGQTGNEIVDQFGRTFLFATLCFFVVTSWLYFASLESSSLRGSIGKLVLGLYVGDDYGNSIGFWQATRRFWGGRFLLHVPYVGIYYFLVDSLCVSVPPGKRAFHDILSGCRVFRQNTTSASKP